MFGECWDIYLYHLNASFVHGEFMFGGDWQYKRIDIKLSIWWTPSVILCNLIILCIIVVDS